MQLHTDRDREEWGAPKNKNGTNRNVATGHGVVGVNTQTESGKVERDHTKKHNKRQGGKRSHENHNKRQGGKRSHEQAK